MERIKSSFLFACNLSGKKCNVYPTATEIQLHHSHTCRHESVAFFNRHRSFSSNADRSHAVTSYSPPLSKLKFAAEFPLLTHGIAMRCGRVAASYKRYLRLWMETLLFSRLQAELHNTRITLFHQRFIIRANELLACKYDFQVVYNVPVKRNLKKKHLRIYQCNRVKLQQFYGSSRGLRSVEKQKVHLHQFSFTFVPSIWILLRRKAIKEQFAFQSNCIEQHTTSNWAKPKQNNTFPSINSVSYDKRTIYLSFTLRELLFSLA